LLRSRGNDNANYYAAFDTVNHNILLNRLHNRYGITGKAFSWFHSYLSARTQHINLDGHTSDDHVLNCGVPHGSVLGPILYSLYTSPLGDIMRYHNMSYHFYADYTQVYLSFRPSIPGHMDMTTEKFRACMHFLCNWMLTNKLKLNDNKSELLVLRASQFDNLLVGDEYIEPSLSARNIGVVFDNTMSMDSQTMAVCKSCFYHINCISRIRRYLSFEDTKQLVQAFVISRIDYCNSLLYGLPNNLLDRQNPVCSSFSCQAYHND
jgi:hypothetical protein